jgi:hypothetical protein
LFLMSPLAVDCRYICAIGGAREGIDETIAHQHGNRRIAGSVSHPAALLLYSLVRAFTIRRLAQSARPAGGNWSRPNPNLVGRNLLIIPLDKIPGRVEIP